MTNQGRPSARFFCGSMNTVTDESEVYTRAIRFYPLVHIRRRDRTPSLRPCQKPKAVKHGRHSSWVISRHARRLAGKGMRTSEGRTRHCVRVNAENAPNTTPCSLSTLTCATCTPRHSLTRSGHGCDGRLGGEGRGEGERRPGITYDIHGPAHTLCTLTCVYEHFGSCPRPYRDVLLMPLTPPCAAF